MNRCSRTKKIGPMSYFWGSRRRFISAWLTKQPDASFGWEWGSDGVTDHPNIALRLLGLDIIYLCRASGHLEVKLLGFWWMR